MKNGNRVRIINPDSSFYGKTGVVVGYGGGEGVSFAKVFINEKRRAYNFLRNDLQVIDEEKKES